MKGKILTIACLLALFLTACNSNAGQEKSSEEIKQLVQQYSERTKDAESASITSEQLIVKEKDGRESVYDLPENEFFVSIAPYVNDTHPCTNHSLTGCQGELVNQEFDIYIEDTDGNVIVDKSMKTLENGFIDIWLPRDKTYRTKIEQNGKTAEAEFSTFKEDGTCITTIQLL
ncbi:CueP family metal-binding protein [Metabacillus malikii]|uniref:Lipoprotein n=1 Tax=Metabacillus malikii TaxID=1504265 RepID=A0ABT9ZI79_9BACI|nr:CueP family metal-binding protein [Metabacillus malikii]MDQ0231984.1 hypothetical protein [Metabacillus malikii]